MSTGTKFAVALAAVVAILGGAPRAAAQCFGQNKVQYRSFPFQIIRTDHFEVYFYDEERAAALDAARMAERCAISSSRRTMRSSASVGWCWSSPPIGGRWRSCRRS
mgnify:CR=1 FL=1